jgi:hypothetical protein
MGHVGVELQAGYGTKIQHRFQIRSKHQDLDPARAFGRAQPDSHR